MTERKLKNNNLPIGWDGDGDSRCCVCAAENTGDATLGGFLVFKLCRQCSDNGDFKEWFHTWLGHQYDIGSVATPNDKHSEPAEGTRNNQDK